MLEEGKEMGEGEWRERREMEEGREKGGEMEERKEKWRRNGGEAAAGGERLGSLLPFSVKLWFSPGTLKMLPSICKLTVTVNTIT